MNKVEGLDLARTHCEKFFAGQWKPYELMGHELCVIEGASCLSVLGPKISQRPEPYLALSCALGTGVQLTADAYEFMNSVNGDAWFGSCHFVVAADGSGTAIYGLVVPLEPLAWERPASVQWTATMINSVIGHAEAVVPELTSRFGGVPFGQRYPIDALVMMT
jgi:hypothetical protein